MVVIATDAPHARRRHAGSASGRSRPEDKPLLADGAARAQPRVASGGASSAAKPRLSAAELRYLTEVDGVDHIALVALAGDRRAPIVAVARCVRPAPGSTARSSRSSSATRWQGLGLGRLLVAELAAGRLPRRHPPVHGDDAGRQPRCVRLIDGLGGAVELRHAADGVRELTVTCRTAPAPGGWPPDFTFRPPRPM